MRKSWKIIRENREECKRSSNELILKSKNSDLNTLFLHIFDGRPWFIFWNAQPWEYWIPLLFLKIMSYLRNYLLFGSLANTNSEGWLGSPAPDMLMADTRNSYSIPSTTSFTAYFFAMEGNWEVKHYYQTVVHCNLCKNLRSKPWIGCSGGLTWPHKLLPFLRFSKL